MKESINSTLAQWLITLPEKEIPYALIRDKWHQYLDRNMKSGRRYLMPSSILARSSYGYLLAHWYRKVSNEVTIKNEPQGHLRGWTSSLKLLKIFSKEAISCY